MALRIETLGDVEAGCRWLADRDPRLGEVYDQSGVPPLRRRSGGFPALLQIICGQQLSVASAASVWKKLCAAGVDDPVTAKALGAEGLHALGLTRQKAGYAAALAAAEIDYDALADLPPEEARATLTAQKGIGPWSAEIYLITAVGHPDIFAPGDLALQEAVRELYGLPARPTPAELATFAERWSPWRAVAMRLLWAYYQREKGREGLMQGDR